MPNIFLATSDDSKHIAWSIQNYLHSRAHAVQVFFIDDEKQPIPAQLKDTDYLILIAPPSAFQSSYQSENPSRKIIETTLAAQKPMIFLLFFEDTFASAVYSASIHESISAIKDFPTFNLDFKNWQASLEAINQALSATTQKSSSSFTPSELHKVDETTLEKGRQAEENYQLSLRYYLDKEFEKAKSALDEAIELCPDFPAAFNNRALARRRLQDFQGALEDMNAAIRLNQNPASNYINRSLIYLDLKQYENAEKDAAKAIELNPQSSLAHSNRAIALQKQGRLYEALQDFDKAIELEDNLHFQYSRARLLEEMQLPMHALDGYANIMDRDNKFADAAQRRQKLERSPFILPEKVAAYTKAIETAPSNIAKAYIYRDRAMIYHQLSKLDEAVKDIQMAMELNPSNPAYHLSYAHIYRKMHGDEKGLDIYTKMLEMNPKNHMAYFGRADTYIAMKSFDEAMTAINQAIALNNRISKYYDLRAVLHRLKNDFTSASADYSESIRINPGVHAYLNRAVCHAELKAFSEALADVNKALEIEPTNLNARNAQMNISRMAQTHSPQMPKPIIPAEQDSRSNTGPDGLPFRLPNVDDPPIVDLSHVFATARQMAKDNRAVCVLTPGRMIMQCPCPPAGTMPENAVAGIKHLAPDDKVLNITVIANNDLSYLAKGTQYATILIPFFGYLLGFGYLGHNVVVFEGHPNAFAIGCKNADMLILDEAMVPLLQSDWLQLALGAMNSSAITIFKRSGQLSKYVDGKFV